MKDFMWRYQTGQSVKQESLVWAFNIRHTLRMPDGKTGCRMVRTQEPRVKNCGSRRSVLGLMMLQRALESVIAHTLRIPDGKAGCRMVRKQEPQIKNCGIEAIEIELFGGDPTNNLGRNHIKPHLEDMGWQPFAGNGAQAGTTGGIAPVGSRPDCSCVYEIADFPATNRPVLYQWPRNIET